MAHAGSRVVSHHTVRSALTVAHLSPSSRSFRSRRIRSSIRYPLSSAITSTSANGAIATIAIRATSRASPVTYTHRVPSHQDMFFGTGLPALVANAPMIGSLYSTFSHTASTL